MHKQFKLFIQIYASRWIKVHSLFVNLELPNRINLHSWISKKLTDGCIFLSWLLEQSYEIKCLKFQWRRAAIVQSKMSISQWDLESVCLKSTGKR